MVVSHDDALQRAVRDARGKLEHRIQADIAHSVLLSGFATVICAVLATMNPAVFGRTQRVLRHVRDLSVAIGDVDFQQLEMAAVLADLGTLELPTDLVTRPASAGFVPANDVVQQSLLQAVTDELLERTPGLGQIRDIVTAVLAPSSGRPVLVASGDARHQQAAGILRIARDFDMLISSDLSAADALYVMAARAVEYGDDLFETFAALRQPRPRPHAFADVATEDLQVGMTFAENLFSLRDVVLIPRGQVITRALLYRIHGEWNCYTAGKQIRIFSGVDSDVFANCW